MNEKVVMNFQTLSFVSRQQSLKDRGDGWYITIILLKENRNVACFRDIGSEHLYPRIFKALTTLYYFLFVKVE